MKAPKVSVISIALDAASFVNLRQALAMQTFQDFEFVGEVGGTIPEAWNRAIHRAKGDVLVFTETDAVPVNEHLLQELVQSLPDANTIVKGLEVVGSPWDLSNLAAHRSLFEHVQFDESFLWAEDTELFCRLKQQGTHLLQVDTAPVIHRHKLASKRLLRRAFRYGVYQARIRMAYPDQGVDVAGVAFAGTMLIRAVLNLLGLFVGYAVYGSSNLMKRLTSKGDGATSSSRRLGGDA